ncbi:hypothetical protein Q7P37_010172 [Cladosporium fusiforme]
MLFKCSLRVADAARHIPQLWNDTLNTMAQPMLPSPSAIELWNASHRYIYLDERDLSRIKTQSHAGSSSRLRRETLRDQGSPPKSPLTTGEPLPPKIDLPGDLNIPGPARMDEQKLYQIPQLGKEQQQIDPETKTPDSPNTERATNSDEKQRQVVTDRGAYRQSVELVVCAHGKDNEAEDITLLVFRVHFSCAAHLQYKDIRLGFKFETLDPTQRSTPLEVKGWSPFNTRTRYKAEEEVTIPNLRSDANFSAQASDTKSDVSAGKEWESMFEDTMYDKAQSTAIYDETLGSTTGVKWHFNGARKQSLGAPTNLHIGIFVRPPISLDTKLAHRFTCKLQVRFKVIAVQQARRDRSILRSEKDTDPVVLDPALSPHFSGTGERLRKTFMTDSQSQKASANLAQDVFIGPAHHLRESNAKATMPLGGYTSDDLLTIVGIMNDWSNATLYSDPSNPTSIPDSESTVTALERNQSVESREAGGDLFLNALLRPNEHIQRLAKIRDDVAAKCHIQEFLHPEPMPEGRQFLRDVLSGVIASLDLLKNAGLVQNSLILLAYDPGRRVAIRATGIDIYELELLLGELADESSLGDKALLQRAKELLMRLGVTRNFEQRVPKLETLVSPLCVLIAFATASYAGSHCHPLGSVFDLKDSSMLLLPGRITMRACHLACLDRYIGGPVWVFGAGPIFGASTAQKDMLLSITAEQFDDLWGPLIGLEKDSEIIAFQTEGGLLYKVESDRSDVRERETLIHWTPAQPGSSGFLLNESEGLPQHPSLPFDPNTTMLIGYNEHEYYSSDDYDDDDYDDDLWQAPSCFYFNRNCTLDAREYQASLRASQLVYLDTAERAWNVDTKGVSISTGWSGSSIATNRTWKLRPGSSWKASILLDCARPGRDIKPYMALRVGLEMSICTGNSERITLYDALMSAFPRERQRIEDLLGKAMEDDASRVRFMNYLNDLGQTGMHETKRLRLFWPEGNRTVLRLDPKLPKWANMLEDGGATCCFAVAVDDCLVYRGDVTRACRNSDPPQRRKSHLNPSKGPLFSTRISLYDNPTAKLPLRPPAILKLDSGRLTVVGAYRDGYAQLAEFWLPNSLDEANETVNHSDFGRRGPRVHAEFLDLNMDTGVSVDVCIVDR